MEKMIELIGNTRRMELEIIYEGKDITKYISPDLIDFSQSDSLNEFDTINLTIQNRDMNWMKSWNPLKGDKIEAKAYLYNWEQEGKVEIDIGIFYIDTIGYTGIPDIVTISALSVDIVSNIMDDKKSRVWEWVTFEKIARDIARECNLELIYDCQFNREYRRKEEKLESHFNFLKRLGKEAGVIVKLYNNKLILFEEEIYEKKEARLAFTKEELKNYSFRTDDTDTYAGCKITYYDNYLGEKVEESFFTKQRAGYKRGTQRVLFINEEQDPPGETKGQKRAYLAKVAAKALKEKNKNAIRGNIEIIGREKLLSVGDVIEINDFGIFKGKYLINKIDIDFKTYNLKLDIRMIEEEKK
ncbi:phage late control D family protein [Fusobacterium ulcerans]